MAIDLQKSQLFLSLAAAARRLPNRPHPATLWRWHQKGVRGKKLETVMIGGKRFTTIEAIQDFCDRLTAAAAGEAPPMRTARQRRAANRRAQAELSKDGFQSEERHERP
jgi:hypothetical protein